VKLAIMVVCLCRAADRAVCREESTTMVEHMVWIKFNEGVSGQRKAEHLDALRALKGRIAGIAALKAGENFSPRSQGFTHGLSVTFESREALEVYARHPDHAAAAGPLRQDAELAVMDFEF
jgi:hypothetical protein